MNGTKQAMLRSRNTFLLTLAAGACLSLCCAAAELTVNVTGITAPFGSVGCSLFSNEAGFPMDNSRAKTEWVSVSGDTANCKFKDVASGRYAVSVAHDINGNRKVETLNLRSLTEETPDDMIVWLELKAKGEPVQRNIVLFAMPKHLELKTEPGIRSKVSDKGDYDAIHTLWDSLEEIGDEPVVRILADKRERKSECLGYFHASSITGTPITDMNLIHYGFRYSFELSWPVNNDVDPTKWSTDGSY